MALEVTPQQWLLIENLMWMNEALARQQVYEAAAQDMNCTAAELREAHDDYYRKNKKAGN